MKFKIQDIDDLKEGRELLESKPHPFTIIFIYILIALISALLIWAWFTEKEIIVKVSGIVRPSNEICTVSNNISGTIKEIKFRNSQPIKQGDILFEIDSKDILERKNEMETELATLNVNIKNLKKFSKCVQDNANYFNKSNDEEKKYYHKFEAYKKENELIELNTEELKKTNKDDEEKLNNIDEKFNLSLNKNKHKILGEIEELLKKNRDNKRDIVNKIKQLNTSIEQCLIKANTNGILNLKMNLEPGMMIQSGAVMATIVPDNNSYKVELLIPDKDIGNLKEGQMIKYNFQSLPYKEYGFLEGTLNNISIDAIINKENMTFFNGEGSLDNNKLYSNKGEEVNIRVGMTCEARIITRQEKMLYYFYHKIFT